MLHLQRTLGNRGVAQLVQAKRLTSEGKPPGIQRKLMVGAAGDQYEQEADAVARQVLSLTNAAVERSMQRAAMPEEEDKDKLKTQAAARVHKTQRQATAEEEKELLTKPVGQTISRLLQPQKSGEEDQEELVQPKAAKSQAESFEAGEGLEAQIGLSKGSGSPLPDAVRGFMEPRFGMDFSHVRVHTGREAVQMNEAVGAQAFTHGQDIYFGAGHSPTELGLTAHELTHVVQQGSGGATSTAAQRSPVQERTGSPRIQGAWTFTAAVTNSNPVIGAPTRGHGSTLALPLLTGVYGKASAWQVASWTIEGGNAHLVMRRDTRYTFVHTGDDNNLLTLRGEANIVGGAEADDKHYAQAEAAVVGNIAVRTRANPAPAPTSLFPPVQDGGRSEATESSIGEVDVSLPVGEGTVDVHIPLTKTDEGELAPLGQSTPVHRDEPGGGEWKSVDVYLVAYMEATADIESAVLWDLAGDVNWADATAQYNLAWEERPIPAAPAPPATPVAPEPGGEETESGVPGALGADEGVSCKNPPSCTPDRCRDLQKEVKRLCDRKRGCEEGMSCKVAKTYIKKNEECANARKKINDECFNGGDKGHKKAEQHARQAARNCKKIIKDKKCKE